MERKLVEILLKEAIRVLPKQRVDGAFPSGQNGPYDDSETPARNTSHWLVMLSRIYDGTIATSVSERQREQFRVAAFDAIEYLLSDSCRPQAATFLHRESKDKDQCNGLIGQAWTIEALVAAARAFDRDDLIDIAVEVFLLHPFHEDVGLWQRVDIDGSVLGFDRTFNHQLWFAAAGSELAALHPGQVEDQITQFLNLLPTLIDVNEDGLIRHLLRPNFGNKRYLNMLFDSTRRDLCRNVLLEPIRPPSNKRTLHQKAIGYHSFNLYALAMLREQYPDHPVWDSQPITAAVNYATSESFSKALVDNPYGYPYNCSGIELAYALSVFNAVDDEGQREWLGQQFRRTYDPDLGGAVRNTPDPITLTARLYEATRILDQSVEFEVEEQ